MKYSQAIEELESIVQEMESANISVDELSARIKRASELINICRQALSSTQEEVESILSEIKEKSKPGAQ
ncbi:MAG: exodeoxyribonuclease VII small subunit [Bacteroidales bacterium]